MVFSSVSQAYNAEREKIGVGANLTPMRTAKILPERGT